MASLSSLKPCWAFEISSSDRYCCYPVAVLLPVQPYVEVEDIFVSKAVRSLQLKLRECLVGPPVERLQHRYSVCFPDRICSAAAAAAEESEDTGGPAVCDEPEPKRMRVETVEEPKNVQETEEEVTEDARNGSSQNSVSSV